MIKYNVRVDLVADLLSTRYRVWSPREDAINVKRHRELGLGH